jgi:hypothetical protein
LLAGGGYFGTSTSKTFFRILARTGRASGASCQCPVCSGQVTVGQRRATGKDAGEGGQNCRTRPSLNMYYSTYSVAFWRES